MGKFETLLRNHDWSYMYSDDRSVYERGKRSLAAVVAEHNRLKCPFPLGSLSGGLYAWVHKHVVELFYEHGQDEWWRTGSNYGPGSVVAPMHRRDLITQEEYDTITKWLIENDTES